MAATQNLDRSSPLLVVAASAVVVCGLYFGREFLIPIALTILFAFLLAPLCTRVQRWGVGRVGAVAIVMTGVLLLVAGLVLLVGMQVADLFDRLPTYSRNLHDKFDPLITHLSNAIDRASSTAHELSQPASAPAAAATDSAPATEIAAAPKVHHTSVPAVLLNQGRAMLSPLLTAGIVIVLCSFTLLQRRDLRDRLITLIGYSRAHVTTEALDEAAQRVSHYLGVQTAINAACGTLLAAGFFLLGLPSALLWGLLAGLLRFIPYFGAWIAALLPFTIALGHFADWTHPLLVISYFVLIETVVVNIVEPFLYGARTGLSPLAILLAAIFWTWLWGAVGLLLAIPLTVCLSVIGKYVPTARFLHIIFGDEPVLDDVSRFYQRLLAADFEDAIDILEARAKATNLAAALEAVVVPALVQAERDFSHGELDEAKYRAIQQAVRELTQELSERLNPPGGEAEDPPEYLDCACVAAGNSAEELACDIFGSAARISRVHAQGTTVEALVAEPAGSVLHSDPSVVVVSALPPTSISQVRHVVKRLLRALPEAQIIVGFWSSRAPSRRFDERIGGGERVHIVNSFSRAIDLMRALRPAAEAPAGPEAVAARA